MSAQYIFTMNKLGRYYPPDRQVLDNINLSFLPGAKIGVIGGNGSGKSSLLKIMAGIDTEFTGEARLTDGYTVGMLEQEPHLDPDKDVAGNVMEGVGEISGLLLEYDEVLAGWSDPDADYEKLGDRQASLEKRIEAANAWDLQRTIEIAMDALRLPPGDSAVTELSGGERRRVALCRLLLSRPDLLLLDEPTNHLDAESVAWLERFLKDYEGTIVAITHDRYFLDNVAEWILELDRGRGHPFQGNYSSWLDQKHARLVAEDKEDDAREKMLKQELEWVRMSPKARQSKGKARLAAYDDLLAQQKAASGRIDKLAITIPANDRLGAQVIDFDKVSKSFGEKFLIDNLSFKLPPAGIVGVIGGNGAGKTTLFRMIIDSFEKNGVAEQGPDSGEITVGSTVDLGYVDQSRDSLDGDKTVFDEISGGDEIVKLGGREMNARAYVGSFNFKGPDQQKLVGQLSGGERNRVHLAKVLRRGANVLMLDEPTNDLDVETLRALEDGLEAYAGCAVIISHDRWFLDRVATHMLAFEGKSQVSWFEGNFSEYAEYRRREHGADAMRPERISYKPLVR